MATVVKQLVTEWVYRVNTTQLKLAEERVKKLQGSVNKVIKDSIALQDKQKNSLNMLKQSYDKLAAATNKVTKAEKKKNVVEKIGFKQRLKNIWLNRAAVRGGRRGGRGGGGFSTRFGNSGMSTIGVGAGAAALAGGGFAVKSIIGLAAEFERNQKTFAAMLKSDEKANQLLADLKDFAKQTPFELTKIRGTATRILGAGYQQNEIIPLMKRLGDLSMGDQDKFNRLLINVAEIKNNDRATIRDIRQFSGVGVDIKTAIQKVTGWDKKDIGNKITQGKVDNKVITNAITYLTTKGVFAGGMEAYQSTLVGKWSNLVDTMQGIGEDAGKGSLSDILKDMVDGTRSFLDDNSEGIAKYLEGVLTAVGSFFTNFFELGGKIKKFVNGMGVSTEFLQKTFTVIGAGLLFMVSPLTTFALALDTFIKVLNGMEDTWVHKLLGVDRQSNRDHYNEIAESMLADDGSLYKRIKSGAAAWMLDHGDNQRGFEIATKVLSLRRQDTMLDDKRKGRGAFDPIFDPMYSEHFESDMNQDFRKKMSQGWYPEQGASQVTINVEGDLKGDPEEFGNEVRSLGMSTALPQSSM